jgi:hypothetical protein
MLSSESNESIAQPIDGRQASARADCCNTHESADCSARNEGGTHGPQAPRSFPPFHELYINGKELQFLTPVIFEDGMDFDECEQYYASMNSPESSGRAPPLRRRIQRKTSLRELHQLMKDSPSCLRKIPRQLEKVRDLGKMRRCSFAGVSGSGKPPLQRSSSQQDVRESSPQVSFHQHVHVVTVRSALEYPDEVRSQIWMSRDEMRFNMQRAVAEKVAERRRELQRQEEERQEQRRLIEEELLATAEEEKEKERLEFVQRHDSDSCVLAECQRTSDFLAAS